MSEHEQAQQDAELQAIQAIIRALDPLDKSARDRVMAYVCSRLGLLPPAPAAASQATGQFAPALPRDAPNALPVAQGQVIDVRTFASQKKPTTVQGRVALIAFYLSELAPGSERKAELSATDLTRYLKQANLPIPARARQALLDAKNAGYIDSGSARGTYKLNPVGYNLIAHSLPSPEKQGP
jgi:hypothetical protein